VAEDLKTAATGVASAASRVRVPWATLAVTALAVALAAWPRAVDLLEFDRLQVMDGEWWRLVTAHWVHFGVSQLCWNLVVLVPAGVWVERLAPVRTRVLFLLAPVVIGAALFAADPTLLHYAGLSGMTAAILALLAFTQLSAAHADRWFWRAVLAVLGVKIAAELLLMDPALARFSDASVRPVPLAHLAGVVCAGAVHNARRRREKI
jgi:rhomboid family GlyGly-CTERM serine protease